MDAEPISSHSLPPKSPWSAGERASVYARLEGLAKLCVTRSGGPALADHIEALAPYLEAFPACIAIAAVEHWPRTESGRYFPTAAELIALAQRLDARDRAKASVERSQAEPVGGRFSAPVGRTANVVRRITAADAKFAAAWLKAGVNVQYRENTIYTTGIGFGRITQRWASLLDEEGVTVVGCPQVSFLLARQDAMMRNLPLPQSAMFEGQRQDVRHPRAPETLEERRAVVAALRAAGIVKIGAAA